MLARTCWLALAVACGGVEAAPRHAAMTTTRYSSWAPPTSKDTHDDPAQVRPGYGNADLHTWFPLTAAQATALQGAQPAAIAESFGASGPALVGKYPEVAAILDPKNPDAQRARVLAYEREGHDLYEKNAWHTMVKMIDLVAPAVSETARTAGADAATMSAVAWVMAYYALGLAIVGRADEAVATAHEILAHLDPGWPDIDGVRKNAYLVLENRMIELTEAKQYDKAAGVPAAHLDACRADKQCASNLSITYRNWASDKSNDGDWPAARDALHQCLSALPDDAECKTALTELETRHQF